MAHFLDVARIGTIIALEEGLELDREWIYAAALPDPGHIQKMRHTMTAEASVCFCRIILS